MKQIYECGSAVLLATLALMVQHHSKGELSSPSASPSAPSSDDAVAWSTFQTLIVGSDQQSPSFLKWANKEDVGLADGVPQSSCPDHSSSTLQWSATDKEAFSRDLEVADQLRFDEILGPSHSRPLRQTLGGPATALESHGGGVATVRFNCDAFRYLQTIGGGGGNPQMSTSNGFLAIARSIVSSSQQPGSPSSPDDGPRFPNPPPGSDGPIIIKTIWQMIPERADFLWTCEKSDDETAGNAFPTDCKQVGVKSNYLLINKKLQMIETDPRASCDMGYLSASENNRIPGECIFHVHFDNPFNPPSGLPPEIRTPCEKACEAVLTGIHMMRFVNGPSGPHWLWATFWWTPTTNGQPGLREPWNHFQVRTISPESLGNSSMPRICFNPYLEGQGDQNGTVSNCIQCHSLAGFTYAPNKTPPVNTSNMPTALGSDSGPGLGLPDLKSQPAIGEEELSYFFPEDSQLIQTQMMWSIGFRLEKLLAKEESPLRQGLPTNKKQRRRSPAH